MTEEVAQSQGSSAGRKFLRLISLILILIALFLTAKYAVPRALVYLTRAAREGELSLANSYLFGAPLVIPADGQTKARVTVFLLSDQGLGVADKRVELAIVPRDQRGGVNPSLQVKAVQPVTDRFGQAVFEVASRSAGQFVVRAQVGGAELPQTLTLTFRDQT